MNKVESKMESKMKALIKSDEEKSTVIENENTENTMYYTNKMKMEFDSKSENEALARMAASAFIMQLDPTMEQMNDIKTAVSEAVTNAIIHGYPQGNGKVQMECEIRKDLLIIKVSDKGIGIDNVELAMEPMYTSKPERGRSGMGFVFMDVFMDGLKVQSSKGLGTTITMKKKICSAWQE